MPRLYYVPICGKKAVYAYLSSDISQTCVQSSCVYKSIISTYNVIRTIIGYLNKKMFKYLVMQS
jgi:hypothetical protein